MILNTAVLWRHDRRVAGTLDAGPEGAPVWLCGVDEVGRGPLAGAVVAACVVLDPRARPIAGVHDSKKLSAEKREALAPRIREQALAFALGEASVEEIDTINIYHASYLAMRRAVETALGNLERAPALVLVDGNRTIAGVELPQKAIVGGDARSACIAAASILAKVARDAAMVEAAELYPHYGFARHKGYATLEHREALLKHGPCPLHRRSFCADLTNLAISADEEVLGMLEAFPG